MARQTITSDGIITFSERDTTLNSNFLELYENKQSPISDNGTFTFLFNGNTEAAQDGNIRFEITSESKINVSRYDSSQASGEEWVLISVIGSISTPYLNLIGTNPRIFTETAEGIYNYIRSTQTVRDGLDVGDLDAKMFISASEIPKIVVKTNRADEVVFSGDSETFSGSTLCTTTTHANYGKDISLKVKCATPSGKMRIVVYTDETKTEIAYTSHDDWQFNINSEGFDLVAGLNTIDLGINPITFGAGTSTCVEFESKGDLSLLGETIESVFYPYLERTVTNGEGFTIASQEYVDNEVGNIDLSPYALKNNVLELDNTAIFTPDNDYEPATKKYVDDKANCYLNTITVMPTSNIENLDVSSLSPVGTLFINNTSPRELKSLAGGINGDIVHLVHLTDKSLKLKRDDSYTGQMMRMPDNADDTFNKYGGCTLIFNSTTGFWHVIGVFY